MTLKTYSEDEFQHAIAKEAAKFQISMLTKDMDGLKQQNGRDLAEIKIQMGQVISMIKDQNLDQQKDRKELRLEIEKEFASKADLIRLESKLDSLWLRITVTVSVLISAGLFAGWLLGIANNLKGLTH